MTKSPNADDAGRPSEIYVPRRTPWEINAGVRHWAAPLADLTPSKLDFSPDLVPLAQHRLIVQRDGGVEAVLTAHLDRFTRFTEHLELEAIVPVCLDLRLGNAPFGVPAALASDAGKVAIDEIWHADAAGALRGGPLITTWPPKFLATLSCTRVGLDRRQSALAGVIFACVSETLITGTLKRVPLDERVRADVRETMREHAREEAFHHALFGQVIGILWPQMNDADREQLGPLFAVYIKAFLGTDTAAEAAALTALGLSPAEAARVSLEAAEAGRARDTMREAAYGTLRYLARHGVLDHDATRRALEVEGLIP